MTGKIQSSEIAYSTASQNDVAGLAKLYHEFYPHLGWTERYLNWQYYENPAGHAKIWVAKAGGAIIATYVAIPHQVYVGGKTGLGWRIQDVITRPEYRGQGIYHHLSGVATKALSAPEFLFSFTFPKEGSTSHNGFIRSGWSNLFQVPLHILADVRPLKRQTVPAAVSSIGSFDSSVDSVWSSHVSRFRFALDRSSSYLNWRYSANPKGKYASFKLTLDGDVLILILKHYDREDGTRWAHLCDWFQLQGHSALTEAAVKHWINFALDLGCQTMSCWSPEGGMLAQILERYHFVRNHAQSWRLVAKSNLDSTMEKQMGSEAQWHLSMGDSDVF